MEEKRKKENKKLKYQKESVEEINQKYFELKEYLDILKSSINTESISKLEIEKNIKNNIRSIDMLVSKTSDLCKKSKIFANGSDTLKSTLEVFFANLLIMICVITFIHCFIVPWVGLIFDILIILSVEIFDILNRKTSTWGSGLKAIIGLLPFNNRYSFVKNFSKLNKLKQEYEMLGKQYDEYLKYFESPEKSKVGESIIKGKEVKDVYLLEITKLIDKVKGLPLGEEREKYLEVLEKLAELYKKEKERIILKNGYVHSEEEIELGNNVVKQLAYIEMQISSRIHKNKKSSLLSEDYLTTLDKSDDVKDKKL